MPNDDYIKRSDAISFIDNCNKLIGRDWLIKELATLPAANVEPVVHGRWVRGYNLVSNRAEMMCSECGDAPYYNHSIFLYNYCPNCGAKMDKEEDDA